MGSDSVYFQIDKIGNHRCSVARNAGKHFFESAREGSQTLALLETFLYSLNKRRLWALKHFRTDCEPVGMASLMGDVIRQVGTNAALTRER